MGHSFDTIYNMGMIQKHVMAGAKLYFDEFDKTTEQELYDEAYGNE